MIHRRSVDAGAAGWQGLAWKQETNHGAPQGIGTDLLAAHPVNARTLSIWRQEFPFSCPDSSRLAQTEGQWTHFERKRGLPGLMFLNLQC